MDTVELIEWDLMRELAREMYVECGIRSAIRISRKLVDLGYPEVHRATIQQWIQRYGWAEEYERHIKEHFPAIMRETAGNLVLAAMHASRKLLEAESTDSALSKERIAQMALAIDRGGFGHVGEARGLKEVNASQTADTRGIHRWLSAEQINEIARTGHLVLAAETEPASPVNPPAPSSIHEPEPVNPPKNPPSIH